MSKFALCISLLFLSNALAQGEFVVAIDNVNGTYTKFNETPLEGIEYLYPNDATIIESSGIYVFASDQAFQDMVFVDIASGTIIESPPLNNTRFFEVDQQTSVLYGLELLPGTNLATPVTIGVPSGVSTPLLGSLGAITYAGNYSDFNQIDKHYVFMGLPSDGPGYILYTINGITGEVISNTPIQIAAEDQINCFKFHRTTNVLYAQYLDASEQRHYLITINPTTGIIQKIGAGYKNASSFGSGTIDLSSNTFVTLYPSPFLNGFAVTTIDLETGAELNTKLLTSNETGDNFYSIEYDALQDQLFSLHYDAEMLDTQSFEDSETVVLYPNPVEDTLYISEAENSTYTIVNGQGQRILEGTISSKNASIDVSKLATGIYNVNLQNDIQFQTQKLVKQ